MPQCSNRHRGTRGLVRSVRVPACAWAWPECCPLTHPFDTSALPHPWSIPGMRQTDLSATAYRIYHPDGSSLAGAPSPRKCGPETPEFHLLIWCRRTDDMFITGRHLVDIKHRPRQHVAGSMLTSASPDHVVSSVGIAGPEDDPG